MVKQGKNDLGAAGIASAHQSQPRNDRRGEPNELGNDMFKRRWPRQGDARWPLLFKVMTLSSLYHRPGKQGY